MNNEYTIKFVPTKQPTAKHNGPAPFGYCWKSYPEKKIKGKRVNPRAEIIIDDKKAVILQDIFQLYALNLYNYISLADEINKKYKTRFSHKYIKKILHNKFYNGYFLNALPHDYPKIVPDEIFKKVEKILKLRKKFGTNKILKNKYKYQGVLSCYYCNTTLSRQLHKGRSIYRCLGYKNVSKKNHAKKSFLEKELDLEFKYFFKKIFSQSDLRHAIPDSLKKESLSIEETQKLFKMLFEHISIDSNMNITYVLWDFKNDNTLTDVAAQSLEKPQKIVDETASLEEKIIHLSAIPQSIDSLAELLNRPISDIQIALIDLELQGKIEQHIEGYWKSV